MKVLFMGTPEFAVASLEQITKKHELLGVVTKVDKPNRRGKKIQYTPVKQYALDYGLTIFQPTSLKEKDFIDRIKEMNPDIIIVVAYGKILPKEILEIPKHGVLNVHSSLLPKYRGAAPIHAALIHGEKETGVSIMYVVEELDAGPILSQTSTIILEEDNCQSLHDRLKHLGASLLETTLEKLEKNEIEATEQDVTKVTFVKPFQKENCKIDWTKNSSDIFNFVRGMDPFPGAYSEYHGKQFKIFRVEKYYDSTLPGKPGEILDFIKGKGILVATGDGNVLLTKVKPENKNILTGIDLINGNFLERGEQFE